MISRWTKSSGFKFPYNRWEVESTVDMAATTIQLDRSYWYPLIIKTDCRCSQSTNLRSHLDFRYPSSSISSTITIDSALGGKEPPFLTGLAASLETGRHAQTKLHPSTVTGSESSQIHDDHTALVGRATPLQYSTSHEFILPANAVYRLMETSQRRYIATELLDGSTC